MLLIFFSGVVFACVWLLKRKRARPEAEMAPGRLYSPRAVIGVRLSARTDMKSVPTS